MYSNYRMLTVPSKATHLADLPDKKTIVYLFVLCTTMLCAVTSV